MLWWRMALTTVQHCMLEASQGPQVLLRQAYQAAAQLKLLGSLPPPAGQARMHATPVEAVMGLQAACPPVS